MYASSPFARSTYLVELGDLPQIQQDGILPMYLPGSVSPFEFKAIDVQSWPNGDYIWMGDLVDRDSANEITQHCDPGYAHILKEGETVYGEIQVDSTYFNLKYLGDSLWILVELDNEAYSGADCAMSDEEFGPGPEQSAQDRSDMCPVRVAVLYTEAAEEANPDILNIINLAIANTNQALRNSAVAKHQLHLILAGTQLLTEEDFTEGDDIDEDMAFLLSEGTAGFTRNSPMFADLVVVMTNAGYDVRGRVADFGGNPNSDDNAIAIVETAFANEPTYTFSHEVGHLFGCRHHNSSNCFQDADDTGPAYAHGYAITYKCKFLGFIIKDWYHNTLMSICFDLTSRTRVLHYSNPFVKYNNVEPTGTEESNYNARLLRESACTVAQYVGGETPLVYITGPDRKCPGTYNTLSGEVVGVPGPCVFEWYISDDGFNWGSPVSLGNTLTFTMPWQFGKEVFIMLIAGNENGPFMTAHFSTVSDTTGLNCGEYWYIRPDRPYAPSSILRAFPNPVTSDLLTLSRSAQHGSAGPYAVHIFDSLGRLVSESLGQMSESDEEIPLNVAHLPNGAYVLRFQSPTGEETLRFAVMR